MYKNFKITEKERKQILKLHESKGYKKPINEQSDFSDEKTSKEIAISIFGEMIGSIDNSISNYPNINEYDVLMSIKEMLEYRLENGSSDDEENISEF